MSLNKTKTRGDRSDENSSLRKQASRSIDKPGMATAQQPCAEKDQKRKDTDTKKRLTFQNSQESPEQI